VTRTVERTGATKDGEPYNPPTLLCRGCGKKLDQVVYVDQGKEYHIPCEPGFVENERRNAELKAIVMKIILWGDLNSARTQQIEIGPSEMGVECDLRIGYILAGQPRVNFRPDPWAAIVGTSIHKWLEETIAAYQGIVNDAVVNAWKTEMKVRIDSMISGHTDLWDGQDVIDWKSAGPDVMQKMRLHGPPIEYEVQAHIYGYAHTLAGRKVRDVVDVFLPRAGWLKDMYIWRTAYNQQVAVDAIKRVYDIGARLIELEVEDHPENWGELYRDTKKCWYCPFYVDRPAEQGPDDTGCPGGSKSAAERVAISGKKFEKGLIDNGEES
jgi:hypothetical protein